MAQVEPSPPELLPKDSAPRRYKGAAIYRSERGYIYEFCPTHPKELYGMVPQHRLVIEESVREALRGRTTQQAAAHLGCHVQTLYQNWDHLLEKRPSPRCLDEHRSEIARMLQERSSRQEVADRFGVAISTVVRSIRRWIVEGATPAEFASRLRRRQTPL